MSEEQLWISEDTIEAESEMEDCCREAVRQASALQKGEGRQCPECGNLWRAESTIRDYRCGCSIAPGFTHLCKEANELELAMFDAVSDHTITEEFPEAVTEDEREQRLDAESQARRNLSAHFSEQVRAGRYRDVSERVLFAHSARRDTEPDAEEMNQ